MASMSSPDQGPKTEAGGGGESSENVSASDQMLLYRSFKKAKKERGCTAKERISKMPPCTAGKRSSIYRGVTRCCDCVSELMFMILMRWWNFILKLRI